MWRGGGAVWCGGGVDGLSEEKKLSAEDFPVEVLTGFVITILLGEKDMLSSLLSGDAGTMLMVFLTVDGGETSLTFLTGVAGETSRTFLTGVAGETSRTFRIGVDGEISRTLWAGDVSIGSSSSLAEEGEASRNTRLCSILSSCEEATE